MPASKQRISSSANGSLLGAFAWNGVALRFERTDYRRPARPASRGPLYLEVLR